MTWLLKILIELNDFLCKLCGYISMKKKEDQRNYVAFDLTWMQNIKKGKKNIYQLWKPNNLMIVVLITLWKNMVVRKRFNEG